MSSILCYNESVKSIVEVDVLKRNKMKLFPYIAVFFIAGLFMFLACKRSNQASMSIPIQICFVGEYCQNGEEWQPIGDDINLSSYKGELVLRGKFEPELSEGILIHFYLNHIGMNLFLNGENVYPSSSECFGICAVLLGFHGCYRQ